jgi:prolyl 4-hydroxylase
MTSKNKHKKNNNGTTNKPSSTSPSSTTATSLPQNTSHKNTKYYWILVGILNIIIVIIARWYYTSNLKPATTSSSSTNTNTNNNTTTTTKPTDNINPNIAKIEKVNNIPLPLILHVYENGQDLVENNTGFPLTITFKEQANILFQDKQFKYYDDDGYFLRKFDDLQHAIDIILSIPTTTTTNNNDIELLPPLRIWRSKREPNLHFIWPTYPRVRYLNRPKSPTKTTDSTSTTNSTKPIILTLISSQPRLFYVSNLVSEEEMIKLKTLAEDPKNPYSMRPSTTGTEAWDANDRKNSKRDIPKDRTSENAFDINSPTAIQIFKRGFEVLRLNIKRRDMFDGLQIVRYFPEQAYQAHFDAFIFNTKVSNGYIFDNRLRKGGNRFATLFLYLSDTELGGQTLFPSAKMTNVDPITREMNSSIFGDGPLPIQDIEKNFKSPPGSWERKLAQDCFSGTHISIKPKAGDAVLFYSMLGDGNPDLLSVHAACPVVKGIKWGANFWSWSQCRYNEGDCVVKVGEDDVNEGYYE